MARSNARALRLTPAAPAHAKRTAAAAAVALVALLTAGAAQAQSDSGGGGGSGAGGSSAAGSGAAGGSGGAGGGLSSGAGLTGLSAGASADTGVNTGGGTGFSVGPAAPGFAVPESSVAFQPSTSLTTGVRSSLVYSDNLLLRPEGAERSGFVAEVSPYALFRANSRSLRGSGFFTLRNFFRSEGESVTLARPELNGSFTARLYDDWLWLDVIGRIGTVAASPAGPISFNQAASGVNVGTVRTYQVSPFVRDRTPWFDYELRYRYSDSNLNNSRFGRTQQSGIASGNTGTRLGRWALGYFGDITQVELGDGRTFGRRLSTGSLAYSVNPELRVGATVSYEQIDNLRGEDGRDWGVGPGAFLDWRPNSRFSLYAQTSRRYYGTTSLARIDWRMRQTTWSLAYNRAVLSSADASLLFFDPAALGSGVPGPSGVNPVTSRLLQQSALLFGLTPLDLTVLSNALVLDKRIIASSGWSGQYNSLIGSIFYNTRESIGSFSETFTPTGPRGGTLGSTGSLGIGASFNGLLTQRGFTLTYLHRLGPIGSVTLTGRRTESEIDGILLGLNNPGSTTLTQVVAGYSARLTSDTTGSFGVRRNVQRRSGFNYTENAVFVTLDKRF